MITNFKELNKDLVLIPMKNKRPDIMKMKVVINNTIIDHQYPFTLDVVVRQFAKQQRLNQKVFFELANSKKYNKLAFQINQEIINEIEKGKITEYGMIPINDMIVFDIDGFPHVDKKYTSMNSTFGCAIAKELMTTLNINSIIAQRTKRGIHLFTHIQDIKTQDSQFKGYLETKNAVKMPIIDMTSKQVKFMKVDIRMGNKIGLLALHNLNNDYSSNFEEFTNHDIKGSVIDHDIFDMNIINNIVKNLDNTYVKDSEFIKENKELDFVISHQNKIIPMNQSKVTEPTMIGQHSVDEITKQSANNVHRIQQHKQDTYEQVGIKQEHYTEMALGQINVMLDTLKENARMAITNDDVLQKIKNNTVLSSIASHSSSQEKKVALADALGKFIRILSRLHVDKETTLKIAYQINSIYGSLDSKSALLKYSKKNLSVKSLVNEYYSEDNFKKSAIVKSKMYVQDFEIIKNILGNVIDLTNETTKKYTKDIKHQYSVDIDKLDFDIQSMKEFTSIDNLDPHLQKLFNEQHISDSDLSNVVLHYQTYAYTDKKIVNVNELVKLGKSKIFNDKLEPSYYAGFIDMIYSLINDNKISMIQSVQLIKASLNKIRGYQDIFDKTTYERALLLANSIGKSVNQKKAVHILNSLEGLHLNDTIYKFMIAYFAKFLNNRNKMYAYPRYLDIVFDDTDLEIHGQARFKATISLKSVLKGNTLPEYIEDIKSKTTLKPSINYSLGKHEIYKSLKSSSVESNKRIDLDSLKYVDSDKADFIKGIDYMVITILKKISKINQNKDLLKLVPQLVNMIDLPQNDFIEKLSQVKSIKDYIDRYYVDGINFDKSIFTFYILAKMHFNKQTILAATRFQNHFLNATPNSQNVFKLNDKDKAFLNSIINCDKDKFFKTLKKHHFYQDDQDNLMKMHHAVLDEYQLFDDNNGIHFNDPNFLLSNDEIIDNTINDYLDNSEDFMNHYLMNPQVNEIALMKQYLATYFMNRDVTDNSLNLSKDKFMKLPANAQWFYKVSSQQQIKAIRPHHELDTFILDHKSSRTISFMNFINKSKNHEYFVPANHSQRNLLLTAFGSAVYHENPDISLDNLTQEMLDIIDSTVDNSDQKYSFNHVHAMAKSIINVHGYNVIGTLRKLDPSIKLHSSRTVRKFADAIHTHFDEKCKFAFPLIYGYSQSINQQIMDNPIPNIHDSLNNSIPMNTALDLIATYTSTRYTNNPFTQRALINAIKQIPDFSISDIYHICKLAVKNQAFNAHSLNAIDQMNHFIHNFNNLNLTANPLSYQVKNFLNLTHNNQSLIDFLNPQQILDLLTVKLSINQKNHQIIINESFISLNDILKLAFRNHLSINTWIHHLDFNDSLILRKLIFNDSSQILVNTGP